METKKIVMNGYCRKCVHGKVAISVTPHFNVKDVECLKCNRKWKIVTVFLMSKEEHEEIFGES